MSFGFGGSPSPFGQQQQQQASPFGGGATPSFGGGAAPNAFGAAAGGAFVGGGSQPGAFGAGAGGFGSAGQQRPAFGSASSSPAFGSGGFGTSAPSPTSSKRLSADLTSLLSPFSKLHFGRRGHGAGWRFRHARRVWCQLARDWRLRRELLRWEHPEP